MKRGSLQLSINAIVIIILAITLLGLGLTFMRTFISQGAGKIGEVLDASQIQNEATSVTPFTIDKNIQMNRGDTTEIFVCFYCDSAAECGGAVFQFENCLDPDGNLNVQTSDGNLCIGGTTPCIDMTVGSLAADVQPHEAVGFKVFLTDGGTMGEGTYTCTVAVDQAPGSDDAKWAQRKQINIVLE